VQRHAGTFLLPAECLLHLEPGLSRDTVLLPVAERLQAAAKEVGVNLEFRASPLKGSRPAIRATRSETVPPRPAAYTLGISARGVAIHYREEDGLRAAVATLRQLLREYGRRLPMLAIRDHADFAKRGVMLDISRGRVPTLETLIELVGHLADFKVNEFQLYIEHTFAYRKYKPVWRDWGAITGVEIQKLDARCRQLGIELVPNQNSFGHLRQWLEYAPLRRLAETDKPWPDQSGAFLRYPSTLAPANPGTLPFLRGLYDELLPNFTSGHFNVGCDETWDLGRGQSRDLCEAKGKGPVYLDFLGKIHREVKARGRRMMFWGDILLHYPELVEELPRDVIALNWGYEADHPFEREAGVFAKSGIPFYVCPGTSTWMTLIGRHDNCFANLKRAAKAGLEQGAAGYLNADWGDGGHPQPLAVSYIPYIAGAAFSWCAQTYDKRLLAAVASRDVFRDATGRVGEAALALGFAHRKFRYQEANLTPFGAVIAAPPPERRELWCRDGLKYYARIPAKNIKAALEEVETQRTLLHRGQPATRGGQTLAAELDMAARMAAQSCKYMLWQQALVVGRKSDARAMATRGVDELQRMDKEFSAYWPRRNKGDAGKSAAFLQWRMEDYRRGKLCFAPGVASLKRPASIGD
jgi:hexosaminidase